jgi:hypothetical protein
LRQHRRDLELVENFVVAGEEEERGGGQRLGQSKMCFEFTCEDETVAITDGNDGGSALVALTPVSDVLAVGDHQNQHAAHDNVQQMTSSQLDIEGMTSTSAVTQLVGDDGCQGQVVDGGSIMDGASVIFLDDDGSKFGLFGPGGGPFFRDYQVTIRRARRIISRRMIHIQYPPITYYWTRLLILYHSYLDGNLTNSKIAETKALYIFFFITAHLALPRPYHDEVKTKNQFHSSSRVDAS